MSSNSFNLTDTYSDTIHELKEINKTIQSGLITLKNDLDNNKITFNSETETKKYLGEYLSKVTYLLNDYTKNSSIKPYLPENEYLDRVKEINEYMVLYNTFNKAFEDIKENNHKSVLILINFKNRKVKNSNKI